jgi:hypothetical protein
MEELAGGGAGWGGARAGSAMYEYFPVELFCRQLNSTALDPVPLGPLGYGWWDQAPFDA